MELSFTGDIVGSVGVAISVVVFAVPIWLSWRHRKWLARNIRPLFLRQQEGVSAVAATCSGLLIAVWMAGSAQLISESVHWMFNPSGDWKWPITVSIITGSMVFRVLIGAATIAALLFAIGRIQRDELPQALEFHTALELAADYITAARVSGDKVLVCSFYPAIGAVNRDEYLASFDRFLDAIKTRNLEGPIQTVHLPLDDSKKGGVPVGERVRSGRSAMATFAYEYYEDNKVAEKKLKSALKVNAGVINDIKDMLDSSCRSTAVQVVPDYHLVLIGHPNGDWYDGLVLLPLVPPGVPYSPAEHEPPFLAMRMLADKSIVRPAARVVEGLVEEYSLGPVASASPGRR